MNRERRVNLENVTPGDAKVIVTSSSTVTTYSMSIRDEIVHVVLTSGNNLTVYLPPVCAAKGLGFLIRVITDGGASLSIDDLGDGGLSAITAADVNDWVYMWSDGTYWYTLASSGV